MKKRIMSMLLTLAMLLSFVPTNIMSAFAQENDVQQSVHNASQNNEPTLKQIEMNITEIPDTTFEFSDVPKDSWYYDSVKYVRENGIFSGTSATEFSPDGELTRAMFVTVLGRMAGVDTSAYMGESEFSDVSKDAYYAPYVAWAKKHGITGGTGDGKFSPDTPVTRQEMATFFVRYFETFNVDYNTEKTVTETPEDLESVASWANDSVLKLWNVGLLNGDGTNFGPTDKATRAQAAALCERTHKTVKVWFCEPGVPKGTTGNEDEPEKDENEKEEENTEMPDFSSAVGLVTKDVYYKVTKHIGDETVNELVKSRTLLSLVSVPTQADDQIFLGWYYDKDFTQPVKSDEKLKKDIELYAKFATVELAHPIGNQNFITQENAPKDFEIRIKASDKPILGEDFTFENITSPERTDGIVDSEAYLPEEELVISGSGNIYTVKVKDGFTEGDTYQFELLNDDMVFDAELENGTKVDEFVRYYNVVVPKKEVLNLALDDGIKYINADKELSPTDRENVLEYAGLFTATLSDDGETIYKAVDGNGVFTYTGKGIEVGDTVAVYTGEKPTDKDIFDDNSGKTAYIEIVAINANTYYYKAANATDVLFTPDILPIDIDEGDGVESNEDGTLVIDKDMLDFSGDEYKIMNLDSQTTVDVGDFIGFFTGDINGEAENAGYAEILSIEYSETTAVISYVEVTESKVLSAMDMVNNSEFSEQEIVDALDKEKIEEAVVAQLMESNFIQDATQHIAEASLLTDEVQEYFGEDTTADDLIIIYPDGRRFENGDVHLMGNIFETAEASDIKVSITVTPKLEHFENSTGVRLEIFAQFEYDVQKDGNKNKLHLSLTAFFEQEVLLAFTVDGGAVWKKKWIIPYIADYQIDASVGIGTYTGIGITATAQLDEKETDAGMPWPTNQGSAWGAKKLTELSKSIKEKSEKLKNVMVDSEATASGGLEDKYKNFMEDANEKWIDIFELNLLDKEKCVDPYGVLAVGIKIDFVVSANLNVALGATFSYEASKRHCVHVSVFNKEAETKTYDVGTNGYRFDLYVMGTMGIKAGIRTKLLVGLFSVKVDAIGVQIEGGLYAQFWGYFYFSISNFKTPVEQSDGTTVKQWEKDKSMSGAMAIEIGAYLDVNFIAEALNGKYSWTPTLYSNQWPFLEIGQTENILDFAYDQSEAMYTQEMLKTSVALPKEMFEMKYMDLKSGEVYGDEKDDDGNWKTSQEKGNRGTPLVPLDYIDLANDKKKSITDYFIIEFDNSKFSYDAKNNKIVVNPGNSVKEEAEMKIIFKGAPLAFTSKTPSRVVNISWKDPEGIRYIEFDTNGGSQIKTISGAGNEKITWPANPTKQGYVFAGWYKDENLSTPYTGSTTNLPGKNDKSFTIYAKWNPATDTPYKVEYYLRQLGSKKFDLITDDTVILKGTTESTVTAPENEYEGFSPIEKVKGEVKPNGSLVLRVYYERNKYDVIFKASEDDTAPTVFNLNYGANVSTPILTRLGYLFDGWDNEVPVVTPAENSVFTAIWIPDTETPYRVEHYFERADKDIYSLNSFEELQGATNTVLNIPEMAKTDIVGITYDRATVNAEETETATILADGTLVIKLYYKRNLYNVNFDTKGAPAIEAIPVAYGKALKAPEKNPEKQGYNFAGWYMDEAYTDAVDFASDKMPANEITLYAKWDPADGVAYKVEHYLAELDGTYTKYELDSLLTGKTESDVTAVPATIEGFAYDEENADNIKVGKVTPDGSLVLKLYYKRAYFDVEWLDNKDEVVTTTSVIYGGSVTAPGEDIIPERTGYIFDGWNVPEEPMPALTIKAYAKWSPITYKVVFNNGLDDAKTAEQTITYDMNTNLAANKFVNPGYVFAGWTDNAKNYEDCSSVLNLCDTQDAVFNLYATWTPGTASYTVEHYKQNVSDDSYTLAETSAKSGTTEGMTEAEAKTYTGFTANDITQETIVGNGSTVVKVYYTRNSYKVFWKDAAGNVADTTSVKYEAEITETSVVPTRTGYTFTSWTLAEHTMPDHDVDISSNWSPITYTVQFNTNFGTNTVSSEQEITYDKATALAANTIVRKGYDFGGWAEKPDGEVKYADSANVTNLSAVQSDTISLYAVWKPASGTKYVSNHLLQNVGDDKYTLFETNEHSGVTESQTNVIAHTYAGFTPEEITQKEISGEGTTEVDVYYTRNSYDILWIGYNGEKIATTSQKFESEIVVPETKTPERTGYTFAGWDVPATTVPVGGISALATWTPVTYKVQFRTNYGENTVANEQTITYDTTVALNANTIQRAGYVFLGWSESPDGAVKYTDEFKVTNLASKQDEVVSLYAVWQAGSGTKYISKHWQQNAENGEYTLYETEEHSGLTESNTTVIAHTYAGFTAKAFSQKTILGDGSTVVDVYYDRNIYDIKWIGHNGEVVDTTSQKYDSVITITDKIPTRTGYIFDKWSLPYENTPIGGAVANATWTPVTYTVSFNANGGEGTMKSQTFTYDSDAELTENAFTRDGYVFVGWAETEDGEVKHSDSGIIHNLASTQGANITLYAVWQAGSGTKYISKHWQQNANDDEYTLYATDTHTGVTDSLSNVVAHRYSGFTAKEFKQETILGDESTVVNVYYDRNIYDIKWLDNDGNIIDTTKQKFGTAIEETEEIPERTGYIFAGWNITADTVPVDGISVSAEWEAITYSVEFRTGFGDNEVVDEQVFTYDETDALNANTIERSGYVFVGWSRTKGGEVEFTDEYKVTNLASEQDDVVTLYAVWQAGSGTKYISKHWHQNAENGEYTLYETNEHTGLTESETSVIAHTYAGFTAKEFDQEAILGDGTTVVDVYYTRNIYDIKWIGYNGVLVDTTSQKYGSEIVETEKIPTRTGYIFDAWSIEYETMPIGGASAVAVWTPITYEVAFDANGAGGTMKNQTFTYDVDEKLSENEFTVDGYNFKGWSLEKDGEISFVDCGIIHNLADTDGAVVTLYAVWQAATDTKYVSRHFQQNIDDDEYTLFNTDNHVGETDTDTNAVAHSYPGFTAKAFKQQNINGDGSTVVNVYYDRNSYDIKWLDNEGNAIATTTQRFGAIIEEPEEAPERTGYIFATWNPEQTTVPLGGASISPTWTPITYTVEFYANGGSGEMEPLTLTYDKDEKLTANSFTWKGYDFVSWSLENTETSFGDCANVINLASTQDSVVKLYAAWKPSEATEYTVNHYQYNVEGTAYELSDTQILTGVTNSMTVAQPNSYPGFTADSFEQKTISNLGDTVISIYYRRNTYEVTFSTNDSKSEVIYGGVYGKLPSPQREGYTFMGWYTLENGSGSEIKEDTVVEITENQTLYPYFTINYYNVTFDANGGSEVKAQSIVYDGIATKPADPHREGYTFLYWANEGEEYEFASPVKADIALTAVWEANEYTLTFDCMGGESESYSKPVVFGETYGTLPVPTKPGYTFEGWFTASAGGSEVNEDTLTDHASNRTIYARWSIEEYTISYELSGGTISDADTSYTVESDSFMLQQPTKTGYVFNGWTGSNGDTAQKIVTVENGTTGNLSYTANWAPITYTVNFYSNSDVSTVVSQTLTYDTSAALNANTFSYTGYTYTGWNTQPGGTGKAYVNGETVYNLTTEDGGVINLYAQWSLNSYTVQFVDHNGTVLKSNTIYHFDAATAPSNPSRTGYTFTGWDKAFDEITGPTTITATYSANSYKFSVKTDQAYKLSGDGSNYASISGMGTSGQLVYDQTYTIVPEPCSGYTYDGYTLNGTRYDKNASKSFKVNYTTTMTITVHFVRNTYYAQTSYYEFDVYYHTSQASAKEIDLTLGWSNGHSQTQTDTDLAKAEDSRYYYPNTYGAYPTSLSYSITKPYSNTLNWKGYAIDAAGNKATVWNGSSSSREGNFGSPSWSGYTATSIPSITVYGNNKMSFNLTTYGVSGAISVTYTTNNSAVTGSGNTITIDGSKFSGTQSVAIYANGKHVQTITIVKG